MSILIPEIELHNTLKAILKLVQHDFENRSNEQDTLLYKLLGDKKLQRYDLYEQAKKMFTAQEDDPRKLDVQMFFNLQRAAIPTIHITLPSEQAGQDGIGIDEGYRDYDEVPEIGNEDQQQTSPTYTRRFDTTYNIIITSDNTNEVILLYHLLRAILIPVFDHLNQVGIENCKISGRDIQANQTLVPQHVFMRALGLSFSYEVNSPGLFKQDIIQKIILDYDLFIEIPIDPDDDSSDVVITPKYLTCSTLPYCDVIQSILEDIEELQQGGGGGGLSCDDLLLCQTIIDIQEEIGENTSKAHTHSNKTILDNITASFTTILKTAYDSTVTWISTNGTNLLNHLSNTSNPHSVTKTQVGLGNVPNTDTTTTANITDSVNKRFVTDADLITIGNQSGTNTGDNAPNSNSNAYADGLVAGLLDDRGNHDASTNLFPSTGGSGGAGAILKGDFWYISIAGVLNGVDVGVGDSIRALADTPGQTASNWSILEGNIDYVPENIVNKGETVVGNETSTTKYLSIKGIYDWATSLFQTLLNKVTSWQVTPDDTHYPSEKLVKDSLDLKLDILALPSNLSLYPTDTISSIPGYYLMVSTIEAAEYNASAVDITTPPISTTNQLVTELVSKPGIIVGNPGELPNVQTISNIRKVSGSGDANFYFEIYHRNLAGTETLIGTSSSTLPVDAGIYTQYTSKVLWNNGVFTATDRIVVKYYANRISGGSNPVFDVQFGGITPTRTVIPVPSIVIPESPFFYIGVNFESAETWTYRAPEDFRINTVDNPEGIAYTIEVNAVAYVLTAPISQYDTVTIDGDIIGFLKLNCELL